MSAAKFTPLQVLQHQKARLQAKSDALLEVVEDDLAYLQDHFGTLLVHTMAEAVVSKASPVVRSLTGRDKNSDVADYRRTLTEGVLEILPFLIEVAWEWGVQRILNWVRKWVSK